jgi:hypothetical protein
MAVSRRGRLGILVSVVAVAVAVALLFVVDIDPTYGGIYFSTGVVSGNAAPNGPTTCGTGSWHLSAPANSKVNFQWYVATFSANVSDPGQGYANVSIAGGSGTPYAEAGLAGSGAIQVAARSGLTISYSLCTDALVSTLTLYGNVTSAAPIL